MLLMKKKRVFVAVNLPKNIKNKLGEYQDEWTELPVRRTKKENLHITLIFLGYLLDEDIPEVNQVAGEAASKSKTFLINLNKICYGPPKKLPPRLIWAEGEESKELDQLKNNLEKLLTTAEKAPPSINRTFLPHITLGRIKAWEWKQIEPEERPRIEKEINLNFEVSSIDIMESRLKREGAEYIILESFKLGE